MFQKKNSRNGVLWVFTQQTSWAYQKPNYPPTFLLSHSHPQSKQHRQFLWEKSLRHDLTWLWTAVVSGLDWWTELVGRVSQLESDFIHIIKHFVKKVLLYLPCSVQAIHTLMIHHHFLSHQNVWRYLFNWLS